MAHRDRILEEFTRQAEAFSEAPILRADEVTRRVGEALGPVDGSVLDLACGPGLLAPALAPQVGHLVGLDLVAEPLRLAARNHAALGNASFARGLADATPFREQSFQGAVLRLALHHFDRPAEVLREAHRVMRTGGRLVVLDLTTDSDPETATLRDAIERLRDPSHTRCLPREEIHALIRASGFAIVEEDHWASPRRFDEWARIISDPVRMEALEEVLRALTRAGVGAGMELQEQDDGALTFTYRWCLVVAEAL